MESILSLRQLTYTYDDGTCALKQIDLEVPKGQRVVLLGHNGAGKSTLMLALNGLLDAKGGVAVNGSDLLTYDKMQESLLMNTGLVFQDPDSQIFNTFIEQELSYGLYNMGLEKSEIAERIDRVCKDFDLLDLMEKPIQHMSFGQKKRIAVASIIAMDPGLIMLDEPTAGLDPKYQAIVLEMLDKLIEVGKGVLVSTHDMELAFEWADHLIVMDHGCVVACGPPVEVFDNWETIGVRGFHLPMLYEMLKAMDPSGGMLRQYGEVLSGSRRKWVMNALGQR